MNVSELYQPLTRKLGRPRRLLVVETDGFVMRGAVVERKGSKVSIQRVAQSKHTDPADALADVVSQLRSTKLPKQAVLLSPDVTSALLRLPVDPREPRPEAQMQELVRWELEPHVAVNGGARPIGEVLVGLGHLTYDNVTDVLAEMQHQKEQSAAMPSGRRRLARFGEVAQEQGLVMHRQVEAALAVQQRFQNSTEDLVCGWSGQPDDKPDEEGQYHWLACGISRQAREAWNAAFEDQDLELLAMYPQIGTSLAALNGQAEEDRVTVVEIQPGAICTTRLVDGRVESYGVHLTAGHRPTSDLCRELAGDRARDGLWLTGRHPLLKAISDELITKHEFKPRLIPVEVSGIAPPEVTPASLSGIVGAARHALRLDGAHQAVSVAAQDAGPPAWREPRTWITAAAVLLPLMLGGAEFWLRWQRTALTREHNAALAQLVQTQQEAETAQARLDEVDRLKTQLDAQRAVLDRRRRQSKFISVDLPNRTRFLPQLLDSLAASVSEGVAIDRIAELPSRGFDITAFALDEQAAEEFTRAVGKALGPWELMVSSRSLGESKGRMALMGYKVQILLSPVEPEPPKVTTQVRQPSLAGGTR